MFDKVYDEYMHECAAAVMRVYAGKKLQRLGDRGVFEHAYLGRSWISVYVCSNIKLVDVEYMQIDMV